MESNGTLTLALVQMRCEKGAIDTNFASIERYIATAAEAGADVVVFPEMSISGYGDPTRMPGAMVRIDGPEVSRFLELTRGHDAAIVAGIIEPNGNDKPFITQLVARNGELLGAYRKRNVAEDEVKWFSAGSEPFVFDHAGVRFGLAICADIDAPAVFRDCAARGATVILECAAPGLYGEQATRDWRSGWGWWRRECHDKLGAHARDLGVYIAVATQAGRTIDEDFPGGGYLLGPTGACLAESVNWDEGMLVVSIPSSEVGRKNQ